VFDDDVARRLGALDARRGRLLRPRCHRRGLPRTLPIAPHGLDLVLLCELERLDRSGYERRPSAWSYDLTDAEAALSEPHQMVWHAPASSR
jgi:hypothetical protein